MQAWFSPAYPVGAFAYSHGLEQEISVGHVQEHTALTAWLTTVLHYGAGRNDAILLAHAWRTPEDCAEISALAEALAPSTERHLETMAQGQAFARVTAEVCDITLPAGPYSVVVGAAAGKLNVPLVPCLRYFLHGFVSNLISAAVRFMPLGQTEGQRVLASLLPSIAEVAKAVVDAPLEDLGSGTFGADLAAMEHEVLPVRIFRT